jgi:acetyltransferase-like isoleucine patch superfamily enzyme
MNSHREMTVEELDKAGLLHAEQGAQISRYAVFVPADEQGALRAVTVGAGAVVGAFAVVHGGTQLDPQARVEEHVVVGKPEQGYAVGTIHPGSGSLTTVGTGAVLRSGAVVYADVRIGANTVIGHHTLLRTGVRVGTDTLLGHHLVVERDTHIGRNVRCSPGSHLTSSVRVADRVFLGAGIRTINDKTLTWRHPQRDPILTPPIFRTGSKVGSGTTVLAGVTVGEHALVGAGSVITHDIPPGVVAYGNPARVHGQACS